MVVARKTPTVPPLVSSRTPSTQPTQKASKKKAPSTPSSSSNPANGKAPSGAEAKHSKTAPSNKRKVKHSSSSSFSNRLFLLLLSVFTIYAFNVCPTDHPRMSRVCTSLDLYRTHVLNPYIVPPLHHLYTQASPHLEPYVTPIRPYAEKTVTFAQQHVVPRIRYAKDFALIQYKRHIAPTLYYIFVTQYWNGIIKPVYLKGLHPHLERHFRPYKLSYRRFVAPYIKRAYIQGYVYYLQAKPHVIHASSALWKTSVQVYEAAEVLGNKAYIRARPHAIVFMDKAKLQALVLSGMAGDARREFVDPHVRRIWEKVGEFSSSTETETRAAQETTVNTTAEPTSEVVTSSSTESEPQPTPVEEETAPPSTPSAIERDAEGENATDEKIVVSDASPIPTGEYAADSAASIVAASLHASASVTADPEPEPEITPSENVDDFLNEIGLGSSQADSENEEFPTASVEAESEEPTYGDPIPSPEELAAMTAEKREKITARHTKWEETLKELIAKETPELQEKFKEKRAAAIQHLGKWGKEGKGVGHEVEAEASRLIKGVEGYLKGVETRAERNPEEVGTEKEQQKWDKVVEKVQERLAEKVRDLQKDVHEWFVQVTEDEVMEARAVSERVKALAGRAQNDLGLDYAWLNDVTYHDWQRYHDLIRTADNFTTLIHNMQGAVEPKGTNPLVDALNDLETEVNDIFEGFIYMLGEVQRIADAVFSRWAGESAAATEPQTPEAEDNKEQPEPEVWILPVPTDDEKDKVVNVEDVFIGRSKEEVEARLAEVPVEDVRAGREEL